MAYSQCLVRAFGKSLGRELESGICRCFSALFFSKPSIHPLIVKATMRTHFLRAELYCFLERGKRDFFRRGSDVSDEFGIAPEGTVAKGWTFGSLPIF